MTSLLSLLASCLIDPKSGEVICEQLPRESGGWKRIAFGTLFEQIHSRLFSSSGFALSGFSGQDQGMTQGVTGLGGPVISAA